MDSEPKIDRPNHPQPLPTIVSRGLIGEEACQPGIPVVRSSGDDCHAFLGIWLEGGRLSWIKLPMLDNDVEPGHYKVFLQEIEVDVYRRSGLVRLYLSQKFKEEDKDLVNWTAERLKPYFLETTQYSKDDCREFCILNALWLAVHATVEYMIRAEGLTPPRDQFLPFFEGFGSTTFCCTEIINQIDFADHWQVNLACKLSDLVGEELPEEFEDDDFGVIPVHFKQGALYRLAAYIAQEDGRPLGVCPGLPMALFCNSNRKWLTELLDPDVLESITR